MEARQARETGLYGSQNTDEQEEQLRERIKELHDEISRIKNGSSYESGLVTPDLVMEELSEQYRILDTENSRENRTVVSKGFS
jgi:spermidine/putrescine-binding protein